MEGDVDIRYSRHSLVRSIFSNMYAVSCFRGKFSTIEELKAYQETMRLTATNLRNTDQHLDHIFYYFTVSSNFLLQDSEQYFQQEQRSTLSLQLESKEEDKIENTAQNIDSTYYIFTNDKRIYTAVWWLTSSKEAIYALRLGIFQALCVTGSTIK